MNAVQPHQLDEDCTAFLQSWSAYVDHFLAARSVLSSALFPEKPAQMWFGYEYARPVLENVTEWLEGEGSPERYGSEQRHLLARANGLYLAAGIWTYTISSLGAVLEGTSIDRERAARVLNFFPKAYASYVAQLGWQNVLDPAQDTENLVLATDSVTEIEEHLQPVGELNLQRIAGALANYSWLLECESRQGIFAHGLYPTSTGTRLLIREFGDLSGSTYPWVDSDILGLEPGPIALVVELSSELEASFDAFGVGRFEPEDYGPLIRRVALVTQAGLAGDPAADLRELESNLSSSHRALYRTVAGWSARDRFIAGATSYARMWAELLIAGGGGDRECEELVYEPLREMMGEPLDRHLEPGGEIALWSWAGSDDRPTIFEPLLQTVAGSEKPVES